MELLSTLVYEKKPNGFPGELSFVGAVAQLYWVVEHAHAWHERFRWLIVHHDRLPEVGAAWTWLVNARLMLNWPKIR